MSCCEVPHCCAGAAPPAISCGERSSVSAQPISGCLSLELTNIPVSSAALSFPRHRMKFADYQLPHGSSFLENGISHTLKISSLPTMVTIGSKCVTGGNLLEALFRGNTNRKHCDCQLRESSSLGFLI